MSFTSDIKQFEQLLNKAMVDVFKSVTIEIGTTVINFSPVLTGRFKGNWQLSINSPSDVSYPNYDASGSSTIAALANGAQSLTIGQVAYIVNNITYGYEIEIAGWPSGKPAYMPVRRTAEEFERIVEEAVRLNQV